MKKYIKISIFYILVGVLIASLVHSYSFPSWKRISPFTDVRFEGKRILIEFQGKNYELAAIEGISSARLIEASQREYGNLWQKRIREDIAEVLEAAGADDDNFVDLVLKDTQTGEENKFQKVEMTEANRSIIYQRHMGF